jgi:hypothetical protein
MTDSKFAPEDFVSGSTWIAVTEMEQKYASLQAENERLKGQVHELSGFLQERIKQKDALQSKLDRVIQEIEPLTREENAKYFTPDELSIFNRILDLLK